MKCKKCNVEVNVLDSFCSRCGVSQSLLDDGPAPIKNEDPFLERGTDELDKELQRAQNGLLKELSGEIDLTGQSPPGQQKSFQTFGTLAAPTKSFFFDLGRVDLKTSEQEIHLIAGFVFQSPHIQSNQLYRIHGPLTHIKVFQFKPFLEPLGSSDDDGGQRYMTQHNNWL